MFKRWGVKQIRGYFEGKGLFFLCVFSIFQVPFGHSRKGRQGQRKGEKGRKGPISWTGGQTPLKKRNICYTPICGNPRQEKEQAVLSEAETVSYSSATPDLHQCNLGVALEQETFWGPSGLSPKRLLAPSPIHLELRCLESRFAAVRIATGSQRFQPQGPKDWKFQSWLKFSILTNRIPHKNRGLVGGALELSISLENFKILKFFNLWALREIARFESQVQKPFASLLRLYFFFRFWEIGSRKGT